MIRQYLASSSSSSSSSSKVFGKAKPIEEEKKKVNANELRYERLTKQEGKAKQTFLSC